LQSPKPYPRIGKILELDKLLRIENWVCHSPSKPRSLTWQVWGVERDCAVEGWCSSLLRDRFRFSLSQFSVSLELPWFRYVHGWLSYFMKQFSVVSNHILFSKTMNNKNNTDIIRIIFQNRDL
jgi:hypothetical protein